MSPRPVLVRSRGVPPATVREPPRGLASRRGRPLLDDQIVLDGLDAADAARHHARPILDLRRIHEAAQLDDILRRSPR